MLQKMLAVFSRDDTMMDIEEKRARYKGFIESEEFSLSTWVSLHLFHKNVQSMTDLVKWEVEQARSIFDITDNTNTPRDEYKLAFIHYDILSKLLMMIEGLCALMMTLCNDKTKLAKNLSHYESGVVNRLAREITTSADKEAMMWKLLCLPNLELLEYLSAEERIFLKDVMAQTCVSQYEVFCGLTNYYLYHVIAYNKFKHGLSLLPGSLPIDSRSIAISTALDRKLGKRRYNIKTLLVQGDFMPEEFEWFNTACVIPVGKEWLETYVKIATRISELTDFVANNNYLFAENCGQDYLPFMITEDNMAEPKLYLRNPPTLETKQKIEDIYEKALKNIHFSMQRTGRFEFFLGKPAMEKLRVLLEKYGAAVIWANKKNVLAPPVKHEVKIE